MSPKKLPVKKTILQAIRQKLYEHDGKKLFDLVLCSPLVVGTVIGRGDFVQAIPRIIVLLVPVIIVVKIARRFNFELYKQKPHQIFFIITLIISSMSAFAVLGVFSRYPEKILFHTAVFGFVPGCILSGAIIARCAKLLEKNGWLRAISFTNKKGHEVLRPRGIARLYAIFTVVIPAFFPLMVPMGYLPISFMLLLLILIFTLRLAEAFQKQASSDEEIALRTLTVAAQSSLLLILIGLMV